jgi:hypothetical protein
MKARGAIVVVAVVLAVGLAGGAAAGSDPARKCRRTVVGGAAKLARARLVALRKCEEAKRAGKLPALGACAAEPAVAAALATATTKRATAVDRACGGGDRRCGGADDLSLAAMQWPGACPDLEGQGCAGALASCADVPGCVACLADAAVTRGLALVYTPFVFADVKTQKAIVRCQQAVAAAAAALTATRVAVDARCLTARLDGAHAAPCPLPGDGKAAGVLTAARAKAEAKVCKACGGADKRCGGGDDLARELIGIAPAWPDVGSCGRALAGVADLVECVDCAVGARADCALAGAAPGVADYPAGCAQVPPTPTPTVTPTPTLTPVASPTFTATPQPTPSPVFCTAANVGIATTTVTLTLATGDTPVGGVSLVLDYPPARVRLPGVADDAAVRARVTDLTGGALLGKGAPNNQDSDADHEPDRVRFTVVAATGVSGAILKITFDRCSAAALTTASDYVCTIIGNAVGTDGVTPVVAACTLGVAPAAP